MKQSNEVKAIMNRQLIANELGDIFKVISHPDRIRVIEELGAGEKDVNSLIGALNLPGPRVSQHLSLLKAHRIVEVRRDGRHHFYHLVQPEIAKWIVEGISFLEGRNAVVPNAAIAEVRKLWASSPAPIST